MLTTLTPFLFAAHPLVCSQVASVVGRAELLSAIFYLTCLLIHWSRRSRDTSKHRGRSTALTLAVAFTGFLCKEQSLTALVVLAVSDLIASYAATSGDRDILSSPPSPLSFYRRKQLSPNRYLSPSKKQRQSRSTAVVLLSGFVFASIVRLWINGSTSGGAGGQLISAPSFNKFDNPASIEDKYTQLLTYAYLAAFHFLLTLWPSTLACDWTHPSLAVVKSVTQPANCITLAFVIICVSLLWRCRRDCQVSLRRFSVVVFSLADSNSCAESL